MGQHFPVQLGRFEPSLSKLSWGGDFEAQPMGYLYGVCGLWEDILETLVDSLTLYSQVSLATFCPSRDIQDSKVVWGVWGPRNT